MKTPTKRRAHNSRRRSDYAPTPVVCRVCSITVYVKPCEADKRATCGAPDCLKQARRMANARRAEDVAFRVRRFWQKVEQGDGCWRWFGKLNAQGYGIVQRGGKTLLAHRYAFTITRGEIPDGMNVCHRCDNPPCVNPAHLFLGSHGDNAADKTQKGRQARGERHGCSKLRWSDVLAMRAAWDGTVAGRRILAEQFNVSVSSVEKILAGETWRS